MLEVIQPGRWPKGKLLWHPLILQVAPADSKGDPVRPAGAPETLVNPCGVKDYKTLTSNPKPQTFPKGCLRHNPQTEMTDRFTAPDYYWIDELLSEEQKLVRNSVREWVKKEVSPIIEEAAQKAEFPMHLI